MADHGEKVADGPRLEHMVTEQAPHSGPPSSTLRAEPAPGDRIGKFVIERILGRGGMGIVVGARHDQLGERVAIKVLHPKATQDKVQVERFIREARATARIKSEHVVRVLDAGVEDSTGAPYIVMEHLEGRDLGNVLATQGPMPVRMAVDYIIQICEAVAAAHALGIIHRDLKPSNFFLTQRPDGSPLVKVLDFGISKAMAEEGAPDPRLTETQAVFGSPTYMSPEQIRSSKNVDPRSDVWSLGVGLFELLTGKMPFFADNVAGLLASVIADPPLPVTLFVPEVPAELEAVVLSCLEKDPSRRIGSCAELAARLAPFADAEAALLAARVERGRAGSSIPVPMPSRPSFPPYNGPTAHGAGSAPPPGQSAPSAPVAFGRTGNDLSATGPAASRASSSSRNVALVSIAAAFMVACLIAALLVIQQGRRPVARAEATAPPASVKQTAPPPPPSPVEPVATAEATAPKIDPAPTSSGLPAAPAKLSVKPGHLPPASRGTAGTGPATLAGASGTGPAPPPPPPATATPNLDSRF